MRRLVLGLGLGILAALPAGGASAPVKTPRASSAPARGARTRTPAAGAPLDFSGTWELDASHSVNASSHFVGAILSVTQHGDRIWIQPIKQGKGSGVLAEEIVADGRAYEKALGPAGKGTVTASWSDDRQSLFIEVKAGSGDDLNKAAMQRSIWKLSADRTVWVRETVSISQGKAKSSRAVFRRVPPESLTPTPKTAPAPSKARKKS
jgi:hypothetical protein